MYEYRVYCDSCNDFSVGIFANEVDMSDSAFLFHIGGECVAIVPLYPRCVVIRVDALQRPMGEAPCGEIATSKLVDGYVSAAKIVDSAVADPVVTC